MIRSSDCNPLHHTPEANWNSSGIPDACGLCLEAGQQVGSAVDDLVDMTLEIGIYTDQPDFGEFRSHFFRKKLREIVVCTVSKNVQDRIHRVQPESFFLAQHRMSSEFLQCQESPWDNHCHVGGSTPSGKHTKSH